MLRSRVLWGHSSFLLNEHFNTDGTVDATKIDDTCVIDRRIADPLFRDLREPLHLAQGGTLGRVHKGFAGWRLQGRILVPDTTQQAKLADRERALRAAFDPYICASDSPGTEGAYALDWDEATGDTTNFPSGRMPVRIYARPVNQPRVVASLNDVSVRDFEITLVANDPRTYRQTESTLVLSPGTPSGNVVNIGTTTAPLKATIVMSGPGSTAFTITSQSVAFILNLSSALNGDTIIVVMEPSGPYGRGHYITRNGTENAALKISEPGTWRSAPVGTTGFTITNHTNVTSCTLSWRSAWA